MFEDGQILDFPQLQLDWGLPETECLWYLQVQHWVLQPAMRTHASRLLTPFVRWLLDKDSSKRMLSELYRHLQPLLPTHKTATQRWWGTEVGHTISGKDWEKIFHRARISARSALLKLW